MRFSIVLAILMLVQSANAQNARYASEQRANAATTYYSRARTMLVEALAEYEQGRRYAQPNMIHDPEEFRLALISLTEELNRLVDPHVKITRDGVRVKGNPRMIRRERERLPEVVDGAQDASDYGEKRRMKEIKEARARMYAPKEETKAVTEEEEIEQTAKEPVQEEITEDMKKQSVEKVIEEAVEEKSEEISSDSEAEAPVESAKVEANSDQDTTSEQAVGETKAVEGEKTTEVGKEATNVKEQTSEKEESSGEDSAVASAIENTIQERLKSLEVGLDEESAE